jgi:hypothetical protein
MSEEVEATPEPEPTPEPTPEPEVLSEDPWEEPSVEPEPEAEPVAVEPAETEQEEKPEKTVPYAAMHEERMMRKEAAQEAADAREKMARMEERFQMIQEGMQKPPEPEPDFDDDPAEFLNAQQQRTQAELQELRDRNAAQDAQAQQNQDFDNLMGRYKADVQLYSSDNADFQEAYESVFKGRVDEYVAAGYDVATSTKIAQQDEVAIVQKAFQDGVNPAERIHALAKARGYAPKPKGGDKIASIAKGQKAAKTLGGSTPPPAVTLEALAEMDDADFAANWDAAMGTKNTSIFG